MKARDDNSQWQFEQEMEQRFEKDFAEFVASHEKDAAQQALAATDDRPITVK